MDPGQAASADSRPPPDADTARAEKTITQLMAAQALAGGVTLEQPDGEMRAAEPFYAQEPAWGILQTIRRHGRIPGGRHVCFCVARMALSRGFRNQNPMVFRCPNRAQHNRHLTLVERGPL